MASVAKVVGYYFSETISDTSSVLVAVSSFDSSLVDCSLQRIGSRSGGLLSSDKVLLVRFFIEFSDEDDILRLRGVFCKFF